MLATPSTDHAAPRVEDRLAVDAVEHHGLAFGIEQIGFQNRDHRASDHAFADVRAVTVDELVREDLGGHVPLVLTIDTEGSDALVLEGARTTLAR